MKVKIDDKLYLESDEYQYILKQYTGKYSLRNEGKENEKLVENYKILGYYGTVTQALDALVSREIKASTASDLKELRKDIQAISKWLKEKLEGY